MNMSSYWAYHSLLSMSSPAHFITHWICHLISHVVLLNILLLANLFTHQACHAPPGMLFLNGHVINSVSYYLLSILSHWAFYHLPYLIFHQACYSTKHVNSWCGYFANSAQGVKIVLNKSGLMLYKISIW